MQPEKEKMKKLTWYFPNRSAYQLSKRYKDL